MLELKGVTKVYETAGVKHAALKQINLGFRKSEFAAILGPSGSGKTTLLNIIGGLDHYTKGDLVVNGRSTKEFKDKDWDAYRNHRIGFVFQSYNLIPHQTILQNVRLALTLSGISKQESLRRAKQALREVGLGDHLNKRPAQLSGGQMQRVAIARALVNDPDIVLADEPTGALDSETSLQIMDILQKVASDRLVIMVTHNPELADQYATRIIRLKDGTITADSNPYTTASKTEAASTTKRKRRRTKMSYFTALSLSLKNLLTKKTRTILVALAGSIGIVGIALISAMSTGFQNYINTVEEDTLTSYPLTLMEESADLTGIMLSMTGGVEGATDGQSVRENQVLTGALGSVSHNDLTGFTSYLDAHPEVVSADVKTIENEYNVDPLIYTVDATGKLAKLNPSNLFTTLIGDTSMLSSYSSLTSVFQQKELSNLQEDSHLVTGRWPENYDEIVISLAEPGVIPDLMTYSLGFHDTEELNTILAKILNGEAVEPAGPPLEISYEDLMRTDLRLVPATATYRYNEKYNVYEDMSEDPVYMQDVYDHQAEKLKIVGIITPNSDMSAGGNGVYYLPSLVTHIITKSAQAEITQRQLANPTLDIFSNKAFGQDDNNFDFEFSDLVSVDNAALQQAFGVTIDQDAIAAKTQDYLGEISTDIDAGTGEVPTVRETLVLRFRQLAAELSTRFDAEFTRRIEVPDLTDPENPGAPRDLGPVIQDLTEQSGTFVADFVGTDVDQYLATQNFSDLEAEFGLPASAFQEAFSGLLKLYTVNYAEWYMPQKIAAMLLQSLSAQGFYDHLHDSLSPGLSTDPSPGTNDGNADPETDPNSSTNGTDSTNPEPSPDSGTHTVPGPDLNLDPNLVPDLDSLLDMLPEGLPELDPDATGNVWPFNGTYPEAKMQDFLDTGEVAGAFDTLSVTVAQVYLKKTILTKIGGLTSYLSSSFADAFHLDQDALLGAFHLNFTEDELTRVISAMFNEKKVTLNSNLSDLGYQDLGKPTRIAFYFNSFDGKSDFVAFLDDYNDQMRAAGTDEKVVEYSDTTGVLMTSVEVIVDAVSYVLIAFVSISLVVSSIMIGVITYISVYERTKEIGILRALGASKHNISSIFNAETFIIGLLAGLFGITISYLLIPIINAVLHHFIGDIPLSATLPPSTSGALVLLSIILTIIGGLIPAHSASKRDPVEALRSE